MRWTLLYTAFLVYMFVATTSRFPLGETAAVAALAGLLFEGTRIRFAPVLLWMGAFMLWCALGVTQARQPGLVFEQVVEFGKLWLIVLVATNALTTRPRIRLYMLFVLGAFAVYPVRGAFLNYFSGYTVFGRAIWNGSYANPNDLAALTLLQLSMVVALLAAGVRGWVRWAAAIGAALLPLLVLMTQSRGGIIALGVFAIAVVIEQRKRLTARRVFAGIVFVSALVYFAPTKVWDRLAGLRHATGVELLAEVDEEGSARQRFEIWKVAIAIIGDRPLMGVGYGSYAQEHSLYAMSGDFPLARGEKDTHSTFLNVAAETGLIGFLIFSVLVANTVLFADRIRRRARRRLPGTAQLLLYLELGFLAFFIAGIWASFAHISFTYLHLGLIWCSAELCRREMDSTQLGEVPAALPAHRTTNRG